MQGDFTPAEMCAGWLDSAWFDFSWAAFLVTLLLEYFGECTIKFTVLLEYLHRAFSICGCLLFYNSLIFHPIPLSFSGSSILCLVYLHNNFQLIPSCLCDDFTTFFALAILNRVHLFYSQAVQKHLDCMCISYWSSSISLITYSCCIFIIL